MKRLVFFIFFLIFCQNVFSIGISPARQDFNFEPGMNQTFTYHIGNNAGRDIEATVTVEGQLEQYFTPKNYSLFIKSQTAATIEFKMQLPNELDIAGETGVGIHALEGSASEGMMGSRTGVIGELAIFVPYPGQYAEIQFNIESVNRNATTPVNLIVSNKGKEDLFSTRAVVDIFDIDDILRKTITFNGLDIKSKETKTFTKALDTKDFLPGEYTSKAKYYYGPKFREATIKFKIGNFNMDITDYTNELMIGTINKFDVTLSSNWNNELEDIFAQITIENAIGTTPTEKNFQRFETKTLSCYIDTSALPIGEYEATITAHYRQKGSNSETNTTKKVKIGVIEKKQEKIIEEASSQKNQVKINYMYYVIPVFLILLIVVIVDIIWLMKKK